ncbi:hypothetical protein CGRA01v4_01646 [Colletotrichum graminicola]|uniref:Cyclin-like F-box n=1 Tax=Colletotrichum graminicola (strain M1.001 / M2 / FGSC 10212) TaxID=645133 RepID=E3QVE3_COLGM|nr:uncharacterized protein GLRG_09975 [Colletotrichum graminicola M1.001]EFQ34831.1 hypothetical protein GLRG_09975 [Colletotrichum graminicola M1.001]WDK10366.1 hypothetical protein CGRA01v4_01646 [Colletotrichum graminicola]
MSPNAPDTSTTPAEIAFADDAEPFVPKPLIDDLLRTRYCIPGSVFLVEDIKSLPVPRSRRWRALRLMLGDGELCIQALLRGEMHRFLDSGAVRVGCYVRLGDFSLRFHNSTDDAHRSGGTRQLVYLVVHDLVTVGWHRSLTVPGPMPQPPHQHTAEDAFVSDSDLDIDGVEAAKEHQDEEDDAGEGFEVMQVSAAKATQRRAQARNVTVTVALPRDWTDPTIPLKLTPLRSIPNLPYKQNWSVNVLAIVTSLSDVEPSHMHPHTQRTARLADPSTTKHVILTVFLDAEEFNPKIGNAVLLVGVKNHRFDGGCLKKYVSDKPKPGARWWFENPRQFDWCDVDGLVQWWEQSQRQGAVVKNA